MLAKIGVALVMLLVIAIAVALLVVCPWWVLLGFVLLLAGWLALTRTGRQTWSVTQVGLATIRQRLGAASVVVLGIAGVVGVLVAVLAMAVGFEATLRQTGDDNTVIVLRAGSQTELNSVVAHDAAELIAQQPQVLRDAKGEPIASPEPVVVDGPGLHLDFKAHGSRVENPGGWVNLRRHPGARPRRRAGQRQAATARPVGRGCRREGGGRLRAKLVGAIQRSIRESWIESSGAYSMKCQEISLATTFTKVMRNFARLEPESIGIGPRSGKDGSA